MNWTVLASVIIVCVTAVLMELIWIAGAYDHSGDGDE
jgi:hypothetical protein